MTDFSGHRGRKRDKSLLSHPLKKASHVRGKKDERIKVKVKNQKVKTDTFSTKSKKECTVQTFKEIVEVKDLVDFCK